MSKHTPGPWYTEQPHMGYSSIRAGKDRKQLVFALACPSPSHGDEEMSDEEKYANLALIAAAPDLMDALGKMYALCGPHIGERLRQQVVEALAKAGCDLLSAPG